tara:strand:+ start:3324 stop:3941 length:618 start_codon:yes stop_codon:yes gene_type:complete
MTVIYEISAAEKQHCFRLASMRNYNINKNKKFSAKHEKANFTSNMIGMLGEFAISKILGIDHNLAPVYDGNSDGGVDLIYNHCKINIKTTHQRYSYDGNDWAHVFCNFQPTIERLIEDLSRTDVFIHTSLGCGKDRACYCDEYIDNTNQTPIQVHITGIASTEKIIHLAQRGLLKQLNSRFGVRWKIYKKDLSPLHHLFTYAHSI